MELIFGSTEDEFLVRFASKRTPALRAGDIIMGTTMPRITFPFIRGAELDELIISHFDCGDEDGTFRGDLRQAVDRVKPGVFTSVCAWRIGYMNDHVRQAEVTLLVTVSPNSTTREDATQIITQLRATIIGYDNRLAGIAVEVAEMEILLAANHQNPKLLAHRDVMLGSYARPAVVGSSIGLGGDRMNTGTMGAIVRASTANGLDPKYFATTCSHVLSVGTEAPVVPGKAARAHTVVCPSDKDNLGWFIQAVNLLKCDAEDTEAAADRRLAVQHRRPVGTLFASSGLRSSADHGWIVDLALVKLDAAVGTSIGAACNIPSPESREKFKHSNATAYTLADLKQRDWQRRRGRYLTTAEITASLSKETMQRGEGPCVFKVGRTTGHTAGRLHCIYPSVTIPHIIDQSKLEVKGKAIAVCNHDSRRVFAECGDSGALVVNGHAEGVGMVIAMNYGSVANGTTLVSPFGPLLDYVKDVLTCGNPEAEVDIEYL
ncbi:hypothetical protein CONLIGDRAFT_637820 [Coniochaeta ligniaria NRRL 30616]|uniref:Uncharacterized protein n=1 Tax=Coniochaeta ligniaria NRRL 30616 TaxID=1408157 RepID=A0A1J7IPZ2_9PEZI|nr:hypothetical protein CONLIGDRAFT_637820 [Coniochaeta ligniaria NRRL 30616]